jgi:phospholipid transport system substrate-binding protein
MNSSAMKRMTFWQLVPVLLFAGTLLKPLVAADNDPRDVVRQTTDDVLQTLREQRETLQNDSKHVYSIIDEKILPRIDFHYMAKLVLGKYWRQASDEEKQTFEREFRLLIVRTYATALLEYDEQTIDYPATHMKPDADDVTVQTVIKQPGGVPIPVNYSLHLTDAGRWQVYDMIIDGISLVTNYRSTFASEIRRSSLQELIRQLIEHNK